MKSSSRVTSLLSPLVNIVVCERRGADILLDRAGNSLPCLDFVAVICISLDRNRDGLGVLSLHTTGTIEETVAGLDGVVDGVGASVVVDLPEPKSHHGHLLAIVQLDGRGRHAGVCSEDGPVRRGISMDARA